MSLSTAPISQSWKHRGCVFSLALSLASCLSTLQAASGQQTLSSSPAIAPTLNRSGEQATGKPAEIASRLQLFLDTNRIERLTTSVLQLHPPVAREVVFQFDAPWEGPESGYVTILEDNGKYRMYYRGGGERSEEVSCLAESSDAIHWTRPILGLYPFNGSMENNIIWKGREKAYWESHNFTPFLDGNPKARAEERYKAVALGRYPDEHGETRKMLVAFVSADGIHWKRLQENPIIRNGSFDSQNLAFWDVNRGEYVCYSRIGYKGYRMVQRSVSKDFLHWSEGARLDFGPTPLEHFYTNAIQLYFREPSLYVGFPMRFVPERKTLGENRRTVDGVSDAVLISSRDGIHFDRTFLEAFLRPGPNPANWGNAHSNNTPAWGILPTGEKELSIFWSENCASIPQLRRGTLRLDGFVSVRAPYHGGELLTRPFQFTGKRLVLNFATSAVGSLRVEIQNDAGTPVVGYALTDSEMLFGDELLRTVSWTNGPDVSGLAGQSIRLRFVLRDADLYSFRFAP